MAARRGKSQAKRTTNTGTPAWVWLVAVVAVGAVVLMAAPNLFKSEGDGFLRVGPRPDPDAVAAPVADADVDAPASAAAGRNSDAHPASPQYDFYTLLPGSEVQMSDAELAALTKAETDRKSRQEQEAARAAAALAGQTPAPALPTPLDESPAASRPVAPPPSDAQRAMAALEGRQLPPPAPIAEKPAPPVATSAPSVARTTPAAPAPTATAAHPAPTVTAAAEPAPSNVRYLLQAGAFGNSSEAEAIKARLAMSGLAARVEPTQVNGGTVYRVRVGPYQSATDLSEAKSKLEASGLQAMAVKVQ